MTDREESVLNDYFNLVNGLYKLFDRVWASNKVFQGQYKRCKRHNSESLNKFMSMLITAMCRADDWYLCDKYIDIVGGNWQHSLFELVGMFIRIKVGE